MVYNWEIKTGRVSVWHLSHFSVAVSRVLIYLCGCTTRNQLWPTRVAGVRSGVIFHGFIFPLSEVTFRTTPSTLSSSVVVSMCQAFSNDSKHRIMELISMSRLHFMKYQPLPLTCTIKWKLCNQDCFIWRNVRAGRIQLFWKSWLPRLTNYRDLSGYFLQFHRNGMSSEKNWIKVLSCRDSIMRPNTLISLGRECGRHSSHYYH